MASPGLNLPCFLVFSFLASSASSSRVSDAVFESDGFTGRSLLQTKTNCPIDFENQNYTIITSRCKGPRYSADLCCPAFKEFACPHAKDLNDMNNDCATTMFSYINLYGKYPPGLFANECKEGKHGLDCSKVKKPADSPSKSIAPSGHAPVSMALLASSVLGWFLL